MSKRTFRTNTIILSGIVGRKGRKFQKVVMVQKKETVPMFSFSLGIPFDDSDSTETSWENHQVEIWGRDAEVCRDRVGPESIVLIQGKLRRTSWVDDSGKEPVDRYRTFVRAERIEFIRLIPPEDVDGGNESLPG